MPPGTRKQKEQYGEGYEGHVDPEDPAPVQETVQEGAPHGADDASELCGGAKESEGGGPAARGKEVADHGDGDGDDGTASDGLEDSVADQGP